MKTPEEIVLSRGKHASPEDGTCLLEASSCIAGEPFSDNPRCVCPVIAAFGRAWNDSLPDEPRNRLLKQFIKKIIGTKSTDAVEEKRAWMANDWFIRVNTVAWLRLAKLNEPATDLESLPEIMDEKSWFEASPTIAIAAIAARDARAASATSATMDAIATSAARDAMAACATSATSAAMAACATSAARDAIAACATSAARDAMDARDASATMDAMDACAARAAMDARITLQPTVALLQVSAVDLFNRMIDVKG